MRRGSGICRSTCDGVGSCAYPQTTVSCADCYTCNGFGSCTNYDYACGYYRNDGGFIIFIDGGLPPPPIDASIPGYGGRDGGIPVIGTGGIQNVGGRGGTIPNNGGSGGGGPVVRGTGGNNSNLGGNGGGLSGLGGATGNIIPSLGGSDGSVLGHGGAYGSHDGGVGEGDASSRARLSSGCSCGLGSGRPAHAGWLAPFIFAGAALLLTRRRKRR
jgi:hypothetical protein